MGRQQQRVVMQQIFELQLAAALEVDAGTAAWTCNLQRRPETVAWIIRPMSHDLDELADVRQVVRERCAGQHMPQIELVSATKAELLSVSTAGVDHKGIRRTARRSGRTSPRASGAMQELPRGALIQLTKQVAVMDSRR